MSQAGDILLALDAYECLGRRSVRGPGRVEPVLFPGTDDFGLTPLNEQSIADLQDLMASWSYRMAQLSQAYGAFAPTWAARDVAALADWGDDFQRLQARYTAAMANAQSAVDAAKWAIATPNYMITGQAPYDALAKAMRQCYPPDGCPIAKGDFDDLDRRLTAARGQQTDYSQIPQPKAVDVSQKILNVTAPVDVVAHATGQLAPYGSGSPPPSGPKPGSPAHYVFMGLSLGAGGLAGLKAGTIIGLPFAGLIGLGLGLLGGFGLFELISSKTSNAVSGISSKLSTASAVAKHL